MEPEGWVRPKDHTPELAARLGMAVEEFEAVLGGRWELVEGRAWQDYDADPDRGFGHGEPWYVQGSPAQLMLRVSDWGVVVAAARMTWDGAVPAGYAPQGGTHLPREELVTGGVPPVVRDILTRRRRSFRWCVICRQVNAPEAMIGDTCHGCSSAVF